MCSLSVRAPESPAVLLPASTESSSALLDLVHLKELMERTRGSADVKIGLIDGPVAVKHPDLPSSNIREIPGNLPGSCARTGGSACTHGTLLREFCRRKEAAERQVLLPTAHCWCGRFSATARRETTSQNGYTLSELYALFDKPLFRFAESSGEAIERRWSAPF